MSRTSLRRTSPFHALAPAAAAALAVLLLTHPALSEDGGTDDGGMGGSGGGGGTGGGSGGMGGAPSSCGDLLIVLDRSGSMAQCSIGGTPKEQIAKTAINTMVTEFPTVGMGLFVFPDTLASAATCNSNACKAGTTVVDVAPDGAPKVLSYLMTMPTSCGGTPTGDSLQRVRDYEGWPGGKAHYVALITDGQPTCQDGDDGGSPPKMCDGKGMIECKNPTKVYEAIKALKAKGIRTFVVGFEGEGSGMGCGMGGKPYNPDVLNMAAELGGVPNTMGPTKYYAATNEATLKDALRKIAGYVGSDTVGGCRGGGGGDGGSGGAGGAGGSGASGGDSGSGGNSGNGGSGGSKGGSSDSGCGCTVGTTTAGGSAAALLLALALASIVERRRRK